MTTTPRTRLSVRLGLSEPDDGAPYEGVPPHLLHPLRRWVRNNFVPGSAESGAQEICLRLRLAVPTGAFPEDALAGTSGAELLDVVDAVLGHESERGWSYRDDDGELAALLDAAGSAYRVTENGDGLEERIAPAVRAAVGRTVADAEDRSSAGSAAGHLSTAWRSAYGPRPDPVRAYSEAIKAVECAAHSVVQPNHRRATLGTMLGEIAAQRHRFGTAIPAPAAREAIAPVEAMMHALWDGQTSRHGKRTATVPETLEAARAGVHLAAALVQWFVSGAVTRS
ncbi:hypothetical protein [Streptomyces sp. NPDC014894]|uniref:hypothetical protein n=1 Tax=Streptomyces sp. NPDC014894 TaxID=3364931 RepID=UPI0036F5F5D6